MKKTSQKEVDQNEYLRLRLASVIKSECRLFSG